VLRIWKEIEMLKLIKKMAQLKRENAQTMVEFAIVFPIVLLITYGIIEFGRMLFIYASVTGASREGARYGAAAGDLGSNLTRYYMDCDGILDAVQRGAILNPIDNNDVSIWYDHGPNTGHITNACPPLDANGKDLINIGDRIGVHVIAHYEPIIRFLGLDGFDINSENARTILVNVDVVGTPAPPVPTQTTTRTTGPSPTNTTYYTPTITRTPTQSGTPTISPTTTQTTDPTQTYTVTPTPACIMNGGPLNFQNNFMSWTVTSISTGRVRMIVAGIDWPIREPALILNEVMVNVNQVWVGTLFSPPTTIASWINDPTRRELGPGQSHTLYFRYSDSLPLEPGVSYSVSLTYQELNSGETCSVSQSFYIPATATPSPTIKPTNTVTPTATLTPTHTVEPTRTKRP
jgi:hypothetical protein